MKNYKHIIFDLDGTLTDSKPGILNAAYYALEKMGFSDPSSDQLNELIGIPLQDYFRIICHFQENQIDEAVKHFRIYYGEKGVYENMVYPGIKELLKELNLAEKNIYISTAKYEKYAWVVADHFGFSPFIKDLIGADAGGKHATKTELANEILKRNRITDLSCTVVIGDKYLDIEAGYNNGIDSIGVTYGYGSYEEMVNAKPTYLVNSVNELRNCFKMKRIS